MAIVLPTGIPSGSREGTGSGVVRAAAGTSAFATVAGALAVSGLAELLLQRIVYRVGVHIPRQGAFLEAYRFATVSGDFAFRTTAVLLAIASALAVFWLFTRQSRLLALLLTALIGTNLLAWPLGLRAGAELTPLVFAFSAACLAGRALGSERSWLRLAVVAGGFALALSQYRAGLTAVGAQPAHVDLLQLSSEAGLLIMAVFLGMAAARRPLSRRTVAISAFVTLLMFASYLHEPSTVAIVSLWATGVTMSLPGVLYIAGFGLVVFSALTWLQRNETRHLAIAVALLMVAGLQPQALHHSLTAFLGISLLNVSTQDLEIAPVEMEDAHAG